MVGVDAKRIYHLGLFQNHSARCVVSLVGLKDYLGGAQGLSELGRGSDLIVSFIENVPALA